MDTIENARKALSEAIDFERQELAKLEQAFAALGDGTAPAVKSNRGPKASAEERQAVFVMLDTCDTIKSIAMTTGLGPRIVGAALRGMMETHEVLLERGKYKKAPPATV